MRKREYKTIDEFLDALIGMGVHIVHLKVDWKNYTHPISQLACRTPVKTTLTACRKNFGESDSDLLSWSHEHTEELEQYWDTRKNISLPYYEKFRQYLYVEGFFVVDDSILTEADVENARERLNQCLI
jgi:hypothetical protein